MIESEGIDVELKIAVEFPEFCILKCEFYSPIIGERIAKELLQLSQRMFGGVFTIEDTMILVDARDEKCTGIEVLKTTLKIHREELIVSLLVSISKVKR